MEATALHEFTARSEGELSFGTGTILKILKEGDGWHRAEVNGRTGLVPNNYVSFRPPWWFQPDQSREEAEQLLQPFQEGTFLIRESGSSPGDFQLSVRSQNGVQHFKVLIDGSGKCVSLDAPVGYHMTSSVSRSETIFLRQPVVCTALFDFDGKEEDELGFESGDVITLLREPGGDWWRGVCKGKSGVFPCTYVQQC